MSTTNEIPGGSGRWTDDRDAAARTVEREAQSARETATQAAGTIRDGASKLVSGARQKAEEQVEQGKSAAATSLEDFTAAIRKASEELGARDQSMAAHLVREAASGLEQASNAIKGQSVQDLTRSVAGFARRQPAAFLIGATLAGVAIGRFARASSDHSDGEGASGVPAGSSYRGGSASARSHDTSIPSDGVNHSETGGTPMTRAGSSGFEVARTSAAAVSPRPTAAEFGASGASGTTGTAGLGTSGGASASPGLGSSGSGSPAGTGTTGAGIAGAPGFGTSGPSSLGGASPRPDTKGSSDER